VCSVYALLACPVDAMRWRAPDTQCRPAPRLVQASKYGLQFYVQVARCFMQFEDYKGKHLNVYQQMFHGVSNIADSATSKVAAGAFALFLVVMGLSVSFTMFIVLATSTSMLGFASFLASWVLAKDEGVPEMQVVSDAIREGSEGFFRTQYGTIRRLSLYLGAGIFALYLFRSDAVLGSQISSFALATIITISFFLGASCSTAAGYVGMWVSVRANVRVASAARRSAREALVVALRAGGFCGIIVVAMMVLGIALLFCIIHLFFVSFGKLSPLSIPLLLVGYGFGASFVALFAQLGGGIYTKAADVGADLVGKVEKDIPEDDPRNPAVIADLVGDNVGDCSARGADLFESIAAEVISAMILGAALVKEAQMTSYNGFLLFPLVVHTLDLVVSAAGIMSVSEVSDEDGMASSGFTQLEDPYEVLKGGYRKSLALSVVGFVLACRIMLNCPHAPNAWMHFAACGLIGIVTSFLYVRIAQYYTDYKFQPVRDIAEASRSGHATNIIAGIGVGLESTALPVLVLSVSLISSYWLGNTSGMVQSNADGLFGTAVATMGMLSTAAYVLTMDIFGPITDNAGGIVEMSHQPDNVREITDLMDAVGNTTKATTKGYAIGSAGLASFLLFSAFLDEVSLISGKPFKVVDIAVPEVFIGGLIGSMIVFVFSSWTCLAVGNTAQEVVREVRRQFAERPGIMAGEEKPDYARCVSIVAEASLKAMIKPGLLAVVGPVAVGVVFKVVGHVSGQELLGAKAMAGLLMLSTITGILMALFFNTSGGAWDNSKKYRSSYFVL
jgi:H(+)-translocating pyrophosphatase